MPDFSLEAGIGGIVAGVDEVGRGPLAGPVVAAAVILPDDLSGLEGLLDDSKKLSAARRARALAALREAGAVMAVGAASVTEIARLNILWASMLAMERAVARLSVRPTHLLIDGNRAPRTAIAASCVVKGDAKSLSIAAASIVAKEVRDRLMRKLDSRHPGYGWAGNAGYPAPAHRAAIIRLGATRHHRAGFGRLL
ncbi:ribonuclease HII [Acidocella sp.]|uniref:ribonuclease HII n=1 Tax=Acidocella sp. TaxID=50710 RepID=UPI00260526D1|nr:ribonuclease HII [Acidocella sp.]